MSSSKQITPISTQLIFGTKIHSKNLTYNDLINYISLRKQFSRLIPQYLNYQNKKYIKNRNFTSNIEVFRKLKQEIISKTIYQRRSLLWQTESFSTPYPIMAKERSGRSPEL